LFAQAASRSEVVCTFLAMLELIRLKQLVCMQAEPFAEIEITKAAPVTVAAGVPPASEGSVPLPDQTSQPEATVPPTETPAPQS